jgi:hypothetical protein
MLRELFNWREMAGKWVVFDPPEGPCTVRIMRADEEVLHAKVQKVGPPGDGTSLEKNPEITSANVKK